MSLKRASITFFSGVSLNRQNMDDRGSDGIALPIEVPGPLPPDALPTG
jgi:hypothetical protein